jgi:phage terminase large subunit GpA-like protein
MDCITNPDTEEVVVMASTRIGKTFIITNVIGYYVDLDPCPLLYVRPRDADAVDFSKREVQKLFANTQRLKKKLAVNEGKESSNTLNLKLFPGGFLKMIGANSEAAFTGYSARIVLLDEVDRYSPLDHGNPSEMAIGRTGNYLQNRKIVFISSPTLAHTATSKKITIHSEFLKSSQAYYHIPCPYCHEKQALEWESLRYNKKDPSEVWYVCAHCGEHISEAQKRTALRAGEWVETYPERPIKGFHISQLYSPFTTFEKIIEDWVSVEAGNDIYSYQRFFNEVLGRPFEENLGIYADSSDSLYNRREMYRVDVPMGASLLTMAVDTQDSWLSYTIIGWGLGREAWVVKSGRIDGDPATPGPWASLAQVIYADYKHESGTLMKVAKCVIDTQGHQTTHVNKFLKGKGPLVQGIFGGRTGNKPIITKAKRETQTGLRKWEIGTENAKTDIFSALTVSTPGPLFFHFPWELDEAYFKELYSERKINGHFKQIGSRRNEKLDELGYNLAAFYIATKNYTIEQYAQMITEAKEVMEEPDDASPEVEEAMEGSETPKDSPVPVQAAPKVSKAAPRGPLSAREKYLEKCKGWLQ